MLTLLVGATGFEPAASWSQTTHSTNWITPRFTNYDAPHQPFGSRELHPIHHSFQRKAITHLTNLSITGSCTLFIIAVSGLSGNRTHLISSLQERWPPLAVPKPINIHLENLIKRTVGFYPLLIQYYPLFSHSDDKSEPQSRHSETSYRSSEEPKALRGLVYPQLSPTIQNVIFKTCSFTNL